MSLVLFLALISFAIASPTLLSTTISKRIVDYEFLENLVTQFLLDQKQRKELPGISKYQIEQEMNRLKEMGIVFPQRDEIGHEKEAIGTLLTTAWYSWSEMRERYDSIKQIGQGSYSTAYKVKLKTGRPETRALIMSYFDRKDLEDEHALRIFQPGVLLALNRLTEVTGIFPTLNAFYVVSHSEEIPMIASTGGKFSDSPLIAGYEMTYGDKGDLRQYRENGRFTYEQAFELCFGMWAARHFTGLFQTDISETNYVMRTSSYYRVYLIGSKEIIFPPGDIPTPIDFASYRIMTESFLQESDAKCFEASELYWKDDRRGGFYETTKVDPFYETLEGNIFKAMSYLKSIKVPEGAPVKTYRLPEKVNEMIKELE